MVKRPGDKKIPKDVGEMVSNDGIICELMGGVRGRGVGRGEHHLILTWDALTDVITAEVGAIVGLLTAGVGREVGACRLPTEVPGVGHDVIIFPTQVPVTEPAVHLATAVMVMLRRMPVQPDPL